MHHDFVVECQNQEQRPNNHRLNSRFGGGYNHLSSRHNSYNRHTRHVTTNFKTFS